MCPESASPRTTRASSANPFSALRISFSYTSPICARNRRNIATHSASARFSLLSAAASFPASAIGSLAAAAASTTLGANAFTSARQNPPAASATAASALAIDSLTSSIAFCVSSIVLTAFASFACARCIRASPDTPISAAFDAWFAALAASASACFIFFSRDDSNHAVFSRSAAEDSTARHAMSNASAEPHAVAADAFSFSIVLSTHRAIECGVHKPSSRSRLTATTAILGCVPLHIPAAAPTRTCVASPSSVSFFSAGSYRFRRTL
mmetsp:Transcript_1546/g.5131  ORF Transcript_1546/g.5131 Transcript_1546/m.5131 type:complete len:267 (-) Transcript_1546:438-1238(-)|eukprot:30980-Pelagococcus_subviridis.AAC.48